MKTLRLAVKREYFEQLKSGEKKKEYREDKPYWRKRLIGKTYDDIIITNGYPRSDEKDKFLHFAYKGFNLEEIIHKHFGNKPITVFAIDCSKRID